MVLNFRRFLLGLIVLLFFWPQASRSVDQIFFPSKLVYRVTWFGLPAGKVSILVERNTQGLKITATARSSRLLDTFYPVRDLWISELSGSPPYPVKTLIDQNEGRRSRKKEYLFDYRLGRARVFKNGRLKKEVPIEFPAYDEISAFVFLKDLKFQKPGEVKLVPAFSSGRFYLVPVEFVGYEEIKVTGGWKKVLHLRPRVPFEGVFGRRGDIHVWLTADDRRLPVKVTGKLTIGNLVAWLIEPRP
ncbi:DUF3108 domain-containing protein [Thermosulfuriphilus sp.]